ncbi:sulfite exporter TauE/SafE family protein [Sphingomonas aracearum]|uniref:Probable membrane transporter protein n=1 Tax=Sphingomonas aracearum TaxID=2283317 RepID=A0A369W0C3_9SPHN|nr:sulfite exporter TauE/SafE family protein [Sphingomonas aracearum]RDE07499.1 sulfite exporter TauE/SafE family protein [Sphingomonas aracearum]
MVPALALIGAGLAAGFAAGLFGIGGGFVVVPALLLVLPLFGGDPHHLTHVAVGTSAATIIVTSLRSLRAHARRNAVEFDVLRGWAPWIVLGCAGGVLLADHVNGQVLTVIFGAGVAAMSINFLVPQLGDRVLTDRMPGGTMRIGFAAGLGTFSSLLGIGGGTLAIMMMTLCGRTIHRAIATASGVGTLIAVPSAIGFALIGLGQQGLPWGSIGYVNMPAAAAVAAMSMITAPLGVAAAHGLPARPLKTAFGIYLLAIAFVMLRRALLPTV